MENCLKQTTSEILKERFKKGKEAVTEKGQNEALFTEFVISKRPEYGSRKGFVRIQNTWRGMAADICLTELIVEFKNSLS